MKKNSTTMLLILNILYGSAFFFSIGLILRLVINYIYLRSITLDIQDIFKTGIMSFIAGVACGLGSWIFAKIDEYKARKSSPSDPD